MRTARVKLERGEHTLLFADLPAEAVASSIRVEGKATGKLEIGSVDTRSVAVPRADDAVAASERRRIEEAIEKLKDEKAALQVSVQAAETQKKLIENLTKLPGAPAPAGGAQPAQPDWGQLFELIGRRAAEAQKAILDTEIKVREVDRRIKDLQGKLASLAPTQADAHGGQGVRRAPAEALEADMVIRYQVRNASWTPFYDARLSIGTKAEAPKLQLVRRAAIQQRTGEAWENVALSLSTARPSAGTAAPTLLPLIIDYEPDRALPVAAASPPKAQHAPVTTRGPAVTRRRRDKEEEIGGNPRSSPQRHGQGRGAGVPGRLRHRRARHRAGDGRDEAGADRRHAARPDPDGAGGAASARTKAYLYAKIATAAGSPLLPGQVALFRDAVFVGNGRLPLLGPGEEHELGFGVDDSIRVKHAVAEEKRGETGIISTSKTDTRSYRITVKNLHERPIQVSVLDQIPVSQNADITVELTGKTAPTRRDVDSKRGVLAWELKLEPAEERAIEFGYRATWPAAKKVTYGQGS